MRPENFRRSIRLNICQGGFVALILIAAVIPAALAASAGAEDTGVLFGTIKDANGNPWPNITIEVELSADNSQISANTDATGKYTITEIPAGTHTVNLRRVGELIFESRAKIAAGKRTLADVSFADPLVAEISSRIKKDNVDANRIDSLTAHFMAGYQALASAEDLYTQMIQAKEPDDKAALNGKIQPFSEQAVIEFQQALSLTAEKDINQATILKKIALSYELAGKLADAAKNYQQAMDLKPEASIYNNLGNLYAKLDRMADAKICYEKSAKLDPAKSALAYRNFGIVLFNVNRLKDAAEAFRNSTNADPENAQAWYLLGASLVGSMAYVKDGNKFSPVLDPDTFIAYRKCIELDPDGRWGAQAQEGLEQLVAMGFGIDSKLKNKKNK